MDELDDKGLSRVTSSHGVISNWTQTLLLPNHKHEIVVPAMVVAYRVNGHFVFRA